MNVLILLALTYCGYGSHGKSPHEPTKRGLNQSAIIGGEPASIRQFPSMVHMHISYEGGYHECAGTIIDVQYILTGGHCLENSPTIIWINMGSTSMIGGTRYKSTKYWKHEQYRNEEAEYDIGAVKTEDKMELNQLSSNVIKLADPGHQVATGSWVTVVGWGVTITSENNHKFSETLRSVKIRVVDVGLCRMEYRGLVTITDRLFCAGNPIFGHKTPCYGDSGGPAIDASGQQVGIVATGSGCGQPDFPAIFTNIGSFRDWLKQKTGL